MQPEGGARVHKVWAVIRREFVERVRTKWFWISAILGPVLFAGIIVFQIMQSVGGAARNIAVVDSTTAGYGARVVAGLGASRLIRATRVAAGPGVVDSLTRLVEGKQLNGFLLLSDALTETGKAEYRASNLSLQTIEELQRALNRLIVKVRLEERGVNPTVVDWAQSLRVTLDQKKISRGRTTTESAGESFAMAWAMAILLFMAILLYGVNVMSSVLEEKTTRIVEVLVSSLRPFQLMLGKVAGAGAVSFFQFVIWGVSARLLIELRVPIARALGADTASAQTLVLPHVPFATLTVFMAFFLGGFLLYSAMFAAVGAMSSNEQEARQAQQPVTYLLMISYLSIIGLTNDPSSTFAKTLSLVPFTSPIATPVRWTAGSMGTGELVASLAMLAVAIVGVTWVASRIYRVGILMTGKRPTMKELVRWVRTA
jgi:ABC-2 type transport system permease protein